MQWILLILAALPAAGQALVPAVCAGCHNSLNAMGGLDLAALPRRFEDRSVRERWIRVYDRVAKGEMPPKGVAFSAAQRAAMLDPLRRAIYEADHAEVVCDGRGSLRRLNRDEYEQNLRDVLKLPDLDIRDMLPEDREGHRFNKAAETLDMSRVQLTAYLAAAALAVALGRLAGLPDQRLAALAHAAHRRFQKGAGSGVDVETSLFGGLAAMRRGPAGLSVAPLQLPPGLRIAVLHAGEAANTRTMLANLAVARAAALPGVETALASMAETAEASVAAIVAGDVSDFLTLVARFAEAERVLSAAAALPIMSASVERCIEVAARAGWVAKPSGAGGGDIVVAFADGLEPTEGLAASAESARIPLLLPRLAPAGALGTRPH